MPGAGLWVETGKAWTTPFSCHCDGGYLCGCLHFSHGANPTRGLPPLVTCGHPGSAGSCRGC